MTKLEKQRKKLEKQKKETDSNVKFFYGQTDDGV